MIGFSLRPSTPMLMVSFLSRWQNPEHQCLRSMVGTQPKLPSVQRYIVRVPTWFWKGLVKTMMSSSNFAVNDTVCFRLIQQIVVFIVLRRVFLDQIRWIHWLVKLHDKQIRFPVCGSPWQPNSSFLVRKQLQTIQAPGQFVHVEPTDRHFLWYFGEDSLDRAIFGQDRCVNGRFCTPRLKSGASKFWSSRVVTHGKCWCSTTTLLS